METLWKPDGNLDNAGAMNGDGDNQAGERFKRWRARNGASQRRLGDMLGISHTSVGKIEGGKQPPKADIIARFEALERKEETRESSDLTLVVPVSDDAQSDCASAAHDAVSHDTPEGDARTGRLTVNPRADCSDPEVNPCTEHPSSEVNSPRDEGEDKVNPLADPVSHAAPADTVSDRASAAPDHAMHRPIEKVNGWVNPPAHEVNAQEIEARMLREHVTRLEADRERDRAQLAELIATLRALVQADAALHSVAPERATRAEDTVPGPSRSETPDPEEWTAAGMKQLMEETRDTVRAGRLVLGRIEEKLIARPGLLIRALVALPVAWCVASGVFMVGILATYGPGQFLQLGHTVFTALRNTYWPF